MLLGLRSAPKDDLGCAPAELVYGTTLRLPGEFFEAAASADRPGVPDMHTRLRTTMASLRPKETSHHRQCTVHLPANLQYCTFVFVRHDAHRTPLQCTYDGPFRVLERDAKYFTLDLNGKRDTVSVDRLKPAFLDADFGLDIGTDMQTPASSPPAPPSSNQTALPKNPPIAHPTTRPPLRIVGRSRAGRVIRLPAKLHNIVVSTTGGSSVVA